MNELTKIPYGDPKQTTLDLPEALEFQQWKDIGRKLLQCRESLQFWIGDWVNYGERTFGEKYSEAYKLLCQDGGYDESYVRKMASIAKLVPIVNRFTTLSFGHHAVVSSLGEKDQHKFLSIAEEERLSVRELNERIRLKLKDKAIVGVNSTAGMWMWENWFTDGLRGFEQFNKRVPLATWPDNDLIERVECISRIAKPLIAEAEKRNLIPNTCEEILR